MIEFKDSDYTEIDGRRVLTYDAIFHALCKIEDEATHIKGNDLANGFCCETQNDDGVEIKVKRYDIVGDIKSIMSGVRKGTEGYKRSFYSKRDKNE